jgi:hypothetical protein
VAIPNAPATPDFTTIEPGGYGQSDYWEGVRDNTNGLWIVGNWVHIATMPAYGVYHVMISDLHTNLDTSLGIQIVTGFNTATATILGYTNQGVGSWSNLRLSATGNGQPVRLELQIAAVGGSQNFKILIGGEARALTANQVTIPKPLVASAASLGGTQRAIIGELGNAGLAASGHIIAATDGLGINFYSGSWLRKLVGTGLVFRLSSGNQMLQVENNDGSNRRTLATTTLLAEDGALDRMAERVQPLLDARLVERITALETRLAQLEARPQ